MYDAIIVGARCAGSPTAMLLARKGYRVLLVDRASFPSDTPKGHFIQPSGVASLERWGLLERIVASGAPAVRRVRFDLGPFALEGSPRWPTGQVAEAYAPRRSVVDQILVEAAVGAGAEPRERGEPGGVVHLQVHRAGPDVEAQLAPELLPHPRQLREAGGHAQAIAQDAFDHEC